MNAQELKDRLVGYLAGKETLQSFQEWFIPASWESDDPLAASVELHLAEFTNGHIDESELKELIGLAMPKPSWASEARVFTTGSSSEFLGMFDVVRSSFERRPKPW